jgi:molybdate transport system substrate-binding protein
MRERVLPGLGISDQVLPKMTAGGSALLEQGEADLQVALLGEILLMPGVDFAGRVPEEFQLVSDCLGAVAEGTSQMQAAERLIAFVASREVQPILERHGLLPVGSH